MIFAKETFEAGSSPWSFDSVAEWGSASVALDTTSKVVDANSLRFSASGEGGGYVSYVDDTAHTEVFIRLSFFIPTAFAFGASSYCGFLLIRDNAGSNNIAFNLEDWGVVQLTLYGGGISYVAPISLPKNQVNTLQIYIKKATSGGNIKMWLNNDVEGSPDYDSGSINSGSSDMQQFWFGQTYAPEAVGDFYQDDIEVATTFITDAEEPPFIVTTQSASEIGQTTATLNGTIAES